MFLLTAAAEMPIRRAASEKLRASAALTNDSRLPKLSTLISNFWLKLILLIDD